MPCSGGSPSCQVLWEGVRGVPEECADEDLVYSMILLLAPPCKHTSGCCKTHLPCLALPCSALLHSRLCWRGENPTRPAPASPRANDSAEGEIVLLLLPPPDATTTVLSHKADIPLRRATPSAPHVHVAVQVSSKAAGRGPRLEQSANPSRADPARRRAVPSSRQHERSPMMYGGIGLARQKLVSRGKRSS